MKSIEPLWNVLITGAGVTASVSDELLERLPLVAVNCTDVLPVIVPATIENVIS